MEIRFSSDVPDGTYFRTGDVEPVVDGDALTVFDGNGSRRSWGQPGVTSTVVVEAPDFVAIHVGFHHKHGGGQFWRFFSVNGKVEQVAWKDLADETRQVVLDAYDAKAPAWARQPGKLRKDYVKPAPRKFGAFKIMRISDDKLCSLHDGSVYEVGKTRIEKARPRHNGGYYVYIGGDAALKQRFLDGAIAGGPTPGQYALVLCECWGHHEYYAANGDHIPADMIDMVGSHKIAVTYCKPMQVVETFEVA